MIIGFFCLCMFCFCKKTDSDANTSTGTLPEDFFETSEFSVQVTVTGFENDMGNCTLALFDSEEGYDNDEPVSGYFEPVVGGQVVMLLDSLPEAIYGISCYHDENDNGELDTGLFGIPQEGFGFSNNPKVVFSQPDFDDIEFDLSGNTEIEIELIFF
jgi:uncharacterized protein (DUF2141 family)